MVAEIRLFVAAVVVVVVDLVVMALVADLAFHPLMLLPPLLPLAMKLIAELNCYYCFLYCYYCYYYYYC